MKTKLGCLLSLVCSGLLLAGFILFLGEATPGSAEAGVFFAAPGGGGSSCSQADPCSLQTARSLAQDGDAIYLAGGSYDQPDPAMPQALLVLTRSVQILGGWDGAGSGELVRDPVGYPSILDGLSARRVISITGPSAPRLDGLTIMNGDASGLGGVMFAGADGGGGIWSVDAAPIIQNNIIVSNTASLLDGLRVMGGGIYIETSVQPALILSNTIRANLAGGSVNATQGEGGGMFLMGPAEVKGNTFEGNNACTCASGKGGGFELGWTQDVASIRDNVFHNNLAKQGGGVYLVWSTVDVSDNLFEGNQAASGGGGLYSYYDGGSFIERNTFLANDGQAGGAIEVYITTADPVELANNLLVGNSGTVAGGVYGHSDWHIAAMTMTHNTLVDNEIGVRASNNMTITMQNNLLADHSTVAVTSSSTSGYIFPDHTLFWNNAEDGLRGTNSINADPGFIDPSGLDYHLGLPSAAVDAGLETGLDQDHDGLPRPSGPAPDIGAFELQFQYIYLPVTFWEP